MAALDERAVNVNLIESEGRRQPGDRGVSWIARRGDRYRRMGRIRHPLRPLDVGVFSARRKYETARRAGRDCGGG